MGVTDFFVGEIATELLKQLLLISSKTCLCKSAADSLIQTINRLLPIIDEIKFSGVELPESRQRQLDEFSQVLRGGFDLAKKAKGSNRWNVYKNLQFARKMEKLEKNISLFISRAVPCHTLADVHHVRVEASERFDRLDAAAERIEQSLGLLRIGAMEEAMRRVEIEKEKVEGNVVGVGFDVGKRKVKEILTGSQELGSVFGICGIGGSGKTTLANQVYNDHQVQRYFQGKILFLTVSQSPNVDMLRARIWGFITGSDGVVCSDLVLPQWNLQFDWSIRNRKLVILDDVWSLPVLEKLIFRTPGCKTLVVSRFKFPTVINSAYDMELLSRDEGITLFCHSAFGQKSIPPGFDANLVNQIAMECKGLPLALKVIGASLRDQSEIYWASVKKRLSRGESICDSHTMLLDRMAISIQFLDEKVRECFMDLGCFPEDMKIPLDVLINMWVETRGFESEDAFAVLVELSNKNLITLVKDARAGDLYSSISEICVTQHDVLRDLAIHLNNRKPINSRKRLLMPRREGGVPCEWERNAEEAFNAEIVSLHTGEKGEMEWCSMEFPKAEVLILNFSGNEYFLPPFITNMPKLRALVVINHCTRIATLQNLSVFSDLSNLRSLWLEKVSIAQLSESTTPLQKLQKISLVLCKINNTFDQCVVDLPQIFPSLSELTIDHCDDLITLPASICRMQSLRILSITNCHNLREIPDNLGNLKCLQILRLYACPALKTLPQGICDLAWLKYLDISQCVNLARLPEYIGKLSSLEKIDMRECPRIWNLPRTASSLRSLRSVICDEEVSCSWKDVRKADLHVEVAQKCFNLDWLDD